MPGEAAVEAKQKETAAPEIGAPGFAAPSFGSAGTRSHEQAILNLQQSAGNRAVASRITAIQRAPDSQPSAQLPGAPFAPKPFYEGFETNPDPLSESIMSRPLPAAPTPLQPPKPAHGRRLDGITALTGGSDLGEAPIGDKPVTDMTYTQTLDEIAALESWLSKRSRKQSTPETAPADARLMDLNGRLVALLTLRKRHKAGKARGAPGARVPKPRSLTEKLDLAHLSRDEMAAELDEIVDYLREGPKPGEIKRLAEIGRYLDERLGAARDADTERVRQTDLGLALNVNYPNVLSEMEEVIRRIEEIRPDPMNAELAFLPRGRAGVPVLKSEADALRQTAKRQVAEYIANVEEFMESAHEAYKARVERNERHNRVHYLVRVYTGVDDLDPNEMSVEYSTLRSDAVAARRELGRGRLLRAMHRANGFGAATDGYANKVGEWEGSLMRGAGRWVLALTILKEGLTLLATGGATALTAVRVARGASLLRTTLSLSATLGTTGFAVGFGGSLYSQSTTGEGISGWKAAKVGRSVGIDSALIGASPGVGMGARNLAGLGESAVGLSRASRYARTAAAELGSGTLLQGGGALAKGESFRDAMVGVGINAGVSGLGGLALKDLTSGRKALELAGGSLLAGGANYLTGRAQGKEGSDLALTTLSGVAGGAVSPHLEESNKSYLNTRAAAGSGSDSSGPAPAPAPAPRMDPQEDVSPSAPGASEQTERPGGTALDESPAPAGAGRGPAATGDEATADAAAVPSRPSSNADEDASAAARPAQDADEPRGPANVAEQQRRDNEAPNAQRALRESTRPDARARITAARFDPLIDAWATMKVDERRAMIQDVLNQKLAEEGAPPVTVVLGSEKPGDAAFNFGNWTVSVSTDTLQAPRLNTREFAQLVGSSSHEGRHAVQFFRSVRVALARGTFNPATSIDQRAVARARTANARSDPQDDYSKAAHDEALEMYDVNFNKAARKAKHGADVLDPDKAIAALQPAAEARRAAQKAYDEARARQVALEAGGRAGSREHRQAVEGTAQAFATWQRQAEETRRIWNEYPGLPDETDAWRIQFATDAAVEERLMARSRLADLTQARQMAASDQLRALSKHDQPAIAESEQRIRVADAAIEWVRRDLDQLAGGAAASSPTSPATPASSLAADPGSSRPSVSSGSEGADARRTGAELKAEQEANSRAKQVQAAFEKSVPKGTDLSAHAYPGVSDAGTRQRLQTDARFRELAWDPAKETVGWLNESTDEALAILHAEEVGAIPPGTTRHLTTGEDFTSGDGLPLDVYAPPGISQGGDVKSLVKKLTQREYEVLLDDRGLSANDVDALVRDASRVLQKMGREHELRRLISIARRGSYGSAKWPAIQP